MKYVGIIIILFIGASSSYGQADAIDKYFSKYKDDESFTMVYISPKMFNMFSKVSESMDEDEDKEIKAMLANLKGLKILTSEKNSTALYEEAIATINTKGYEELMTVRSDGDHVKFLVKDTDDGNTIQELLLLVGGDEFVLMSFVGDIDLKTIGRLAKSMDIKHVDKLEKLDHE